VLTEFNQAAMIKSVVQMRYHAAALPQMYHNYNFAKEFEVLF